MERSFEWSIEKTIDKINSSSEIIVWLGPCIGQESFEVGNDVYDLFINKDSNTKKAFKLLKNRYYLDLAVAARLKLNHLNIDNISGAGVTEDFCTFRDQKFFFISPRWKYWSNGIITLD